LPAFGGDQPLAEKNKSMEMLSKHAMFIIPIVVMLITQATKFIIYSIKNGWDIHYALTHGHMPSAHTAFVTALATSIGFYEGTGSGSFAIAIILALIVVDDSMRVRAYMGDQGRYLNRLVERLHIEEKFPRLKEHIGHRFSEVVVGGIFGFTLTMLLVQVLAR
jgi:hypothetical protein